MAYKQMIGLLGSCLLAFSCNSGTYTSDKTSESPDSAYHIKSESPVYSNRVYQNPDGTFAYAILQDDKPFIKQEVIPVLAGQKGFNDSVTALRVSELVLKKIKNNQFPPTLRREELEVILNSR